MINRNELTVGDKVRLRDGTFFDVGITVPTSKNVPTTEVNVMADRSGSVSTVQVARLERLAVVHPARLADGEDALVRLGRSMGAHP
ncbi:hypothetical protein [Umezawaea tangerina]|uniref:Uncharacterized protein n=1 Tax=Umezawaea tangerina TaxID=84725 RepID=A0A2T0SPL1_9PSEU|nr:hypothetical protein [Umezawaea tangerina]PRY35362.1 hypothetical protein CLV43_114280 [Umezawaea tangerina]